MYDFLNCTCFRHVDICLIDGTNIFIHFVLIMDLMLTD